MRLDRRASERRSIRTRPEAFQQWLHARPDNAEVYKRAERLWESLPLLPGVENAIPLQKDQRPSTARRFFAPAIGALAAGLVLAIGLQFYDPVERQTFQTGVGEIKAIRLGDGSEVTLGPASAISAEFSRHARRVTLTAGQAYFDVTHDEKRSFIVASEDTEVRVLGTAFDVHHGATTITVSVLRGRVQVADKADGSGADRPDDAMDTLTEGQRVIASLNGALSDISTIDLEKALDWRNGRLTYADSSFNDVVADLKRYVGQPIAVPDPAVGRLRVTASFDVQQYRDMLRRLRHRQRPSSPGIPERPAHWGPPALSAPALSGMGRCEILSERERN